MDIVPSDLDFIAKNATSNSAILFLGAGFSAEATNRRGGNIPVGSDFARILWGFLGYPGNYDNTALTTMFEAALKRKHSDLQRLLEDHFICKTIPDWYQVIPKFFWARIYTTNVDNLIEEIYKSAHIPQKLDVFNAIVQDYRERDQFLGTVQYVKLNGALTDKPTTITFSTSQYSVRLTDSEPWYDQFVRDYATRCTIFIGTKLDEPLFWQAIAARGKRFTPGEPRPKSFIISRNFSPAQIETLKDYGVIPIPGTAKEFFDLLTNRIGTLPSLEQVVLKSNPGLDILLKSIGDQISDTKRRRIEAFYSCFTPIRPGPQRPDYRSHFLLGTEPQWEDIYNDFDAPREFNAHIIKAVQESLKEKDVSLIAVTGSAGSGKSTTLKRTALTLANSGHLVFFTHSQELPALHDFESAIELLPGRSVIFFDNATLAIGILADYLAAAKRSHLKHVFVIAARTNALVDRFPALSAIVRSADFPMPDLSLSDINNIIDLLDRRLLLGRLANMPKEKQREIFLGYAHNQILVAMRRATLGSGFDDIIRNEFLTAKPLEAQMLYLCASLATDAQFTISKQQLISCVNYPPAETLKLIQDNLRGVLIPALSSSDRYSARHRVIAELLLEKIAPRTMLREAYIALLKAISHDLPFGGDRTNSANFRLFRRLISHRSIYERFAHHLSEARSIYSAIASNFSRDHHFWLQFGSLELEFGELASAANYIEQAYNFAPHDKIVINTRAHLIYKQSLEVTLIEEAQELRNEARTTLLNQMSQYPSDNYPFHIYCSQELAWIHRWLVRNTDKKKALEELRAFANECLQSHAYSTRLKEIATAINGAYLDLAKPNSEGQGPFNPVIG